MNKTTEKTRKYEKGLSLQLATLVKKHGLPSISFLEMEIIEFNEERYHKFVDASFTDLSVDMEEVEPLLHELVANLADNLIGEYCQEWTVSSGKLGLIWNIKIDFNADEIEVTTKERIIRDVPKPDFSFVITE